MLPMLMIFPLLRVTMDWAASFESRNTALSCVSMTLSQSSGFSFNTPPLNDTLPALFTRMLTRPSSLSTFLNAGSSPARCVISTFTASDAPPMAFNSESTRWFFSSFLPNTATEAPASANPSAMPRPIPPFPPVTTATRPARSNKAGVFIKYSHFESLQWHFLSATDYTQLVFGRVCRLLTGYPEVTDYFPFCRQSPRLHGLAQNCL